MRRLQVITPLLLGLALAAPDASRARPDRDRAFHHDRAAGAAGLRAAADPCPGLHLDAGLLGLWDGWLLLGAGHLGAAAAVGLLWTPGYWGWNSGVYAWNGGYWGPHVGFYGGVNYGFGYRRRRLLRRALGSRRVRLQSQREQFRQRPHHQRLQPDRDQQQQPAGSPSMAATAASPRGRPRSRKRSRTSSMWRRPRCRRSTSRPPPAIPSCATRPITVCRRSRQPRARRSSPAMAWSPPGQP